MTNNIETVNTFELREGDIVWHYGMRIELGARGERRDANGELIVVWFYGLVTNPEDVNAALVPVSFRTSPNHPEFAPGTFWQIQGNDLARWGRETETRSFAVCPTCGFTNDTHSPRCPNA